MVWKQCNKIGNIVRSFETSLLNWKHKADFWPLKSEIFKKKDFPSTNHVFNLKWLFRYYAFRFQYHFYCFQLIFMFPIDIVSNIISYILLGQVFRKIISKKTLRCFGIRKWRFCWCSNMVITTNIFLYPSSTLGGYILWSLFACLILLKIIILKLRFLFRIRN